MWSWYPDGIAQLKVPKGGQPGYDLTRGQTGDHFTGTNTYDMGG